MASTQPPAPRRVRLTDQALVAVGLARRVARSRGAPSPGAPTGSRDEPAAVAATVADLLAGLAAEPDGAAGRVLRAQMTAATALTERVAIPPPGLARLEAAVARGDRIASPRPPGTVDLLAAALEVGGTDLADLVTVAGYDPRALYRSATRLAADAGETLGLATTGDEGPPLAPDAALAVARTRAAAGGAVDLVVNLAAGDTGALVPFDPVDLAALHSHLRDRTDTDPTGPGWDAGVDAVVGAARAWRGRDPVRASDLLRAAVVAGGHGPRLLLDEAERLAPGGSP
jgi:hypothetical protein